MQESRIKKRLIGAHARVAAGRRACRLLGMDDCCTPGRKPTWRERARALAVRLLWLAGIGALLALVGRLAG
jgi:hypothetical protein